MSHECGQSILVSYLLAPPSYFLDVCFDARGLFILSISGPYLLANRFCPESHGEALDVLVANAGLNRWWWWGGQTVWKCSVL